MRARLTAALAVILALTGPAAADEVHLTNGKSFEDVVARVDDHRVTIELPGGGEIVLPRNHVERVDRGRTPLEIYRERSEALREEPTSGAADWLRLAGWARENGLSRGRREAALAAARLAPEDPAVQAEMRLLGYTLDAEAGDWVTVPEAMQRRGLVPYRGQWVTPAERDRDLRIAHEAARDRARDQRLDRLTRAIEATAELELAKSLAAASRPAPAPAVVYSPAYPIYVLPGFFLPHPAPVPAPAPDAGHDPPRSSVPPSTSEGEFSPVRHAPGKLGSDTRLVPGRLDPGPMRGTGGRR